jgi:hypothetical protein
MERTLGRIGLVFAVAALGMALMSPASSGEPQPPGHKCPNPAGHNPPGQCNQLASTSTSTSTSTSSTSTSTSTSTTTTTIAPPPACSDGFDNDGDGSTDYPADLQCTSDEDTDEGPLDNGDGWD